MMLFVLRSVLLCALADDGAPPTDTAAPPTPSLVDETIPIVVPNEPVVVIDAPVVVAPAPLVVTPDPPGPPSAAAPSAATAPAAPPPAPSTPPPSGFFDDGQPGAYLRWYGAEYLAIAAIGTLYASGAHELIVPAPALIGPRVDLASPDVAALFDPRLNDAIGRSYVQEQVPATAVAVGGLGTLAGIAVLDLATSSDLHRAHALAIGGLEALTATTVVTEVMKATFGRLRPDFRERWQRAACAGATARPDGLDCSLITDGFVVDEATLLDGMRSFPSGHTSASFAVASFAGLALAHRWILDDTAPAYAAPLAAAGISALVGTAAWVGATRVEDHRHHLDDVVVGAAVGSALGGAAYYLHFDARGHARTRSWTLGPTVTPGGGVGVMWNQPL